MSDKNSEISFLFYRASQDDRFHLINDQFFFKIDIKTYLDWSKSNMKRVWRFKPPPSSPSSWHQMWKTIEKIKESAILMENSVLNICFLTKILIEPPSRSFLQFFAWECSLFDLTNGHLFSEYTNVELILLLTPFPPYPALPYWKKKLIIRHAEGWDPFLCKNKYLARF